MNEREQVQAISGQLQPLATALEDLFKGIAGAPIGFVLIVSVAHTAQYVSNCTRRDGAEMVRDLLARWDAGRAEIPASYNPDLAKPLGHFDVTFEHHRGEIATLTFEQVPADSAKDAEARARVHLSIPDAWSCTGTVRTDDAQEKGA